MANARGKSPGGEASRTLTATRTGATFTIAITPDVNPESGWAMTIEDAEWQSFLRACAADTGGASPRPTDVGAEYGALSSAERVRLNALRVRFAAKVRHAAPETTTFTESYDQGDAAEWGTLGDELRQAGWTVEVGDLDPLYGEGTVTIRR
jgi:hypothetical protein